ncbi:hypothetical protein EMIHUDRAFT_244839 [Emiliania huxleyi CCMP1516]|uniref:Ribosomal RNA-processing protein 12-like conserved domain-containing protein n=2 Tax=Emiliania huxleyi TaxID=2903 RepID=A0A0D3IZG3_EMIH1|nr:hypothetical protein EMIHUDRAFT_244839 [Emiliania huxleyi CCMP1516]EOD16648.1 hypothetical protein EMIHUDRAFT_244839 [Emiliania huxleyi CCMP1516]|eukprot:XP_005769077.1 hypothetical protein EMIHUDRAFT_244839 [Emiliania huxleyi CCMP1516]
MAATVLSYFWELASLDVDRRVKAASSLIAALNTAQSEFAATSAAGGQPLCPDLEYAVRRLVRGLASPRDGARQGFGAALIELCAALEIVTPELILEQIESTLQLTGAAKGSEERDVLFGRLFACSALVRSHRVAALPAERQSATAARLSALLIAVGGAKAFLQEPAAAVTCELIRTLDPSVVEESVWPTVAPLLPGPLAGWSPHGLMLALALALLELLGKGKLRAKHLLPPVENGKPARGAKRAADSGGEGAGEAPATEKKRAKLNGAKRKSKLAAA